MTTPHDVPGEDKRAQLRRAALDYHEHPTPGKISIAPTKQLVNQHDLSLAYSPGVAAPCEEIVRDPAAAFRYTARGNLVGVVTNGTAVLGLGDIGPPAGNQPPLAVASATPASGTAPLAVQLSANGSSDADGSIVAYSWDLGDGSAPVSGSNVSHTYAQGSYTATLTVTDDQGLTDSASVAIDATPPVSTPSMHVQAITVTLSGNKRNTVAIATVEIRDGDGNPVAGAQVDGRWSGVVSGSDSVLTDTAGIATFRSSRTRSNGTFALEVTGVALSGYAYDAADNLETSDSASN